MRKVTVKKVKNYYSSSTSKRAKKIGDLFLLAGTTTTMISIEHFPTWVLYSSVACTFLGKAITNLFTEDK